MYRLHPDVQAYILASEVRAPQSEINIKKDWTNNPAEVSLKRGLKLPTKAGVGRLVEPPPRAETESSLDIVDMPQGWRSAGKRPRVAVSPEEVPSNKPYLGRRTGEPSPGEGPSAGSYAMPRFDASSPDEGPSSRPYIAQRFSQSSPPDSQVESEGRSESRTLNAESQDSSESDEPVGSEGPATSSQDGSLRRSGRRRTNVNYAESPIPVIDLTGRGPRMLEPRTLVVDLTVAHPKAPTPVVDLTKEDSDSDGEGRRRKKKARREEVEAVRGDIPEKRCGHFLTLHDLQALLEARPDITDLMELHRSSLNHQAKHNIAPYAFQEDGTLTTAYREIFMSHDKSMRATGESGAGFFDSGFASGTPKNPPSHQRSEPQISTPIMAIPGERAPSPRVGTEHARPSVAGHGEKTAVASATVAAQLLVGVLPSRTRHRPEAAPFSAGRTDPGQGTTVVTQEEASSRMARRRPSNPGPTQPRELDHTTSTRTPSATAQSSTGTALVLRNRSPVPNREEYVASFSGGLLYHVDYEMTSRNAEYQARWRTGPMQGGRNSRGMRDGR